tara:strand:+ start:3740 stop:4576 length:837 start_codon:yes stop_codon:yes gene_type:complete
MKRSSIAVVHLVRKSNGLEPFKNFLSSYVAHKDPLKHDLVIIFKDFNPNEKIAYLEVLNGIEFLSYDFADDIGLDLGPYVEVSRKLNYEYFCFLNSFSEIRCSNWLTYLYNCLQSSQNAGIVGATGSWESSGTNDPPFPNPHIRTNGFIIRSTTMRQIEFTEIRTKDDARYMESGCNSITRQIISMGKQPYVVDCSGVCWSIESWPASATFRCGDQKALLISDNRTKIFDTGDGWTKEYLFDLAWTNAPSKANPFKRQKLRHRLRRFIEKSTRGNYRN